MHISNIRLINRSKWRFWGGYALAIGLISLAIYFSFRSPYIGNSNSDKMEQRDKLWAKMGSTSKLLSQIYDLEKSSASAENRDNVDKLDKKAAELLSDIKVVTDEKDISFAVYAALRDFRLHLGDVRSNKNLNDDQIDEKYRKKYELENIDLRNQLRNLQAAKNAVNSLAR